VGAELEDSLQHWPSHQIALHTRDIDRGLTDIRACDKAATPPYLCAG
jgi:hypothetical protein